MSRRPANRANAQKSTGPKTPGGKRNASRNSLKHGILAKTILVDFESRERFFELLRSLVNEFEPATSGEYAEIEIMAVTKWRLFRLWAVEATGIIHEQRRQAAADPNGLVEPTIRTMLAMRALADNSRYPETLSRYEVRFDRQYQRHANRLSQLQDKRNARQPTLN